MTEYNPFSLEGKTIVVTGASSGIGAATAIECSKLGARIIATARNEMRLGETMSRLSGQGHLMLLSDLADQSNIESLVKDLPTIDGAVLCAGVGSTLPFQFCSRQKMDDVFNVNFFATVELLRLLVKKKKMQTSSSVVIVSSVEGNGVYSIGNSAYAASKGALNTMMKQAALELAPKKIRVNSVNPGMVRTRLIQEGISMTEEQLQEDEKRYPLGRYGEPEDIAKSILFLLSDASCWMTGHALVIDGGVSLL